MSTPSSTPGRTPQRSVAGSVGASGPAPAAESPVSPIKNPGSSGRIPVTGVNSISGRYLSSERKTSSRNTVPGGKSAKDMAADREALGLSAMKPSEMVVGLDQVAKRAAKLEAREIAKKKAGGGISVNTALLVDDTSRRWTWKVRFGLAGAALVMLALLGALYCYTNRSGPSPRKGNQQTRGDLLDLKTMIAPRMMPFDEDESVTIEMAKQRLTQAIDAELTAILEQIKKDKENHRPIETQITQRREWLRKLRDFKDAWGRDFTFRLLDANTLEISATGKKDSGSSVLAPVTISLRAKKKKR
ncbi:MAG: hypothetical protein V1899_03745 [Planctomycetota bacterium]